MELSEEDRATAKRVLGYDPATSDLGIITTRKELAQLLPAVRAEGAQAAERENAHLRLVAQKAGCPYGHMTKGGCDLGYPGCACMDDMLAMMAWGPEDEEKATVRLGNRLQAAERERDELRLAICGGEDGSETRINSQSEDSRS